VPYQSLAGDITISNTHQQKQQKLFLPVVAGLNAQIHKAARTQTLQAKLQAKTSAHSTEPNLEEEIFKGRQSLLP
jgi:hypothetical protein